MVLVSGVNGAIIDTPDCHREEKRCSAGRRQCGISQTSEGQQGEHRTRVWLAAHLIRYIKCNPFAKHWDCDVLVEVLCIQIIVVRGPEQRRCLRTHCA
jgi:hypothetical protein